MRISDWSSDVCSSDLRWLTPLEFTELLSVAQFLPGANVINLTIGIGTRFAGLAGGAAAFAGLIFMPIVIVMLLGMAYGRYGDLPFVAQGFRGLSAAAAGLVVAMAVQIAWPVLRSLRAVALALVIFLAIGALRLPRSEERRVGTEWGGGLR